MGPENTLYYPNGDMTINAFRSFFRLIGITAGDGPGEVRSFSLNFGDGETTSVIQIENGKLKVENLNSGWYTLGGMQLQGEPTEKGVYIYNGKKVVKR